MTPVESHFGCIKVMQSYEIDIAHIIEYTDSTGLGRIFFEGVRYYSMIRRSSTIAADTVSCAKSKLILCKPDYSCLHVFNDPRPRGHIQIFFIVIA